ncbi:MAG: hypothetical protein ABIV47_04595, partial [Roseiflexaceae bacterium]
RRCGAEAHFVANNGWLLISIVVAFAGFFIAAPGAVWHRGYLTERLGEVRFVPLIGEHAWEPAEPEARSRRDEGDGRQTTSDE